MSRYPRGRNLPSWAGLILCLLIGFVFVCIGTGIEQVEREEMDAVTISYEKYKVFGSDTEHIGIMDADGQWYEVHHTSSDYALRQKLNALSTGMELELLLHPESEDVLGIYRDGTPLLGWQEALQEIRQEDRAFFWLGIVMWALSPLVFAGEKIQNRQNST